MFCDICSSQKYRESEIVFTVKFLQRIEYSSGYSRNQVGPPDSRHTNTRLGVRDPTLLYKIVLVQ